MLAPFVDENTRFIGLVDGVPDNRGDETPPIRIRRI
jgi:hypothetical protein